MTVTWMSAGGPEKSSSSSTAARAACVARVVRRPDAAPREAGVALLMALMVTLFVSAVGGALVLLAATETRIAGGEEWRHEARGVAEVLLERVFQDLSLAPDWTAVLSGGAGASFQDPAGRPRAVSWDPLDLAALTLNVQREADDFSRWGPDGPRWRLYAFGPADRLFAAAGPASGGAASGGPGADRASAFYVIAWVADDPGEGDDDPGADRNETVQVRAEAFGPMRTRCAVLATVRRKSGMLQLVSWRLPDAP
jgi:hypothetical protein